MNYKTGRIMERRSLVSIFLMQKDELTKKIAQAASVKNMEDIRSTIAGFFDTQLSPNGEYASQLSQAEFSIMQSSMFVKDLQKKLDEKFFSAPIHEIAETTYTKPKVTSTPMAFTYSIIGGLLGSWTGAPLAGAIAGLVISTWLYKSQPELITKHKYTRWIIAKPVDKKEIRSTVNYLELNTSEIMKIFEEICVGVDDMMQVVANQIKGPILPTPEQKSVTQELDPIIRECQKHIGLLYKAGIDADDIGIFEDIWLTIGVEFVHYSEEMSDYFIEKTSLNTSGISEQYPAVLINGKLHLQGLISSPESK